MRRRFLPLGCALLALACASKLATTELPIEMPKAFSRTGADAAPDRFWTAFGDEQLNALVDEALRSNLDLMSGFYRLEEARAMARVEGAARFPEVTASADAELRHPSAFQNDVLRLGLSASYEIDLFGRLGSRTDAARHRAAASRFDYRTLSLSIAAQVTTTWYRLVEARAQLQLLSEQIEINEKILVVVQSQFGAGQIRSVDVVRQRQLVEATRARRLEAEAVLMSLRHQLAVLLGRPPTSDAPPPRTTLPDVPALPATRLPAQLVSRRPDVQRAYRLLLAADRDAASAVAERFPRLSLSASGGTRGLGGSARLFRDWYANLAANLFAPLFDGGRLAAEVDRATAIKMQRFYDYGQAALIAFREVEDALVREDKQRQRIASLKLQVAMARNAYDQLQVEYLNGIADYIDVLTALSTEQQLRRDLLAARREALEYRIALYRALGGGFDPQEKRE